MREGKRFDVTDVEAEMAAKKAKEDAERKRALARGSKNEIRTTKDIKELSNAGIMLDQKKLDEARKKIAGGTEEIPLSEEDLEEIEEVSNENLEETN